MKKWVFSFFAVLILAFSTRVDAAAYVSSNSEATVTAIDTDTNTVIATIGVSDLAAGIVSHPNGAFVYVACSDGTVNVIDTATNTVLPGPIAVGPSPMGLAITPDGSKLYVANSGDGTVSVVSTTSNSVTATVAMPMNSQLTFLEVSPAGDIVYVVDSTNFIVYRIVVLTDMLGASTPNINDAPNDLAVSSDGGTLYVTADEGQRIQLVDTVANTLPSFIGLPGLPFGAEISPDGDFVYVSGDDDMSMGYVVKVNTATNMIDDTYSGLGQGPKKMALTPDGLFLYVAIGGGSETAVINTTTGVVVANPPTGLNPLDVTITSAQAVDLVVTGEAKLDKFLTQCDVFNRICWEAPEGVPADEYQIFRNGVLIATVSGDVTKFNDHNFDKKPSISTNVYTIVGLVDGLAVSEGDVTIVNDRCKDLKGCH